MPRAATIGSYLAYQGVGYAEPHFDRALNPSPDLGAVDARAVRRCTVGVAVGHDRHAVVAEGRSARVAGADTDRIEIERHPLRVDDLDERPGSLYWEMLVSDRGTLGGLITIGAHLDRRAAVSY